MGNLERTKLIIKGLVELLIGAARVPVRVPDRSPEGLRVHAHPDRLLPRPPLGPLARPYRPPGRGPPGDLPRPCHRRQRRALGGHPGPRRGGPRAPAEAIRRLADPLQRPDDGPRAQGGMPPRRALTGFAGGGRLPAGPLGPGLRPNPEGLPHHRRPRRGRGHRGRTHRRGNPVPKPRPCRLRNAPQTFHHRGRIDS